MLTLGLPIQPTQGSLFLEPHPCIFLHQVGDRDFCLGIPLRTGSIRHEICAVLSLGLPSFWRWEVVNANSKAIKLPRLRERQCSTTDRACIMPLTPTHQGLRDSPEMGLKKPNHAERNWKCVICCNANSKHL